MIAHGSGCAPPTLQLRARDHNSQPNKKGEGRHKAVPRPFCCSFPVVRLQMHDARAGWEQAHWLHLREGSVKATYGAIARVTPKLIVDFGS